VLTPYSISRYIHCAWKSNQGACIFNVHLSIRLSRVCSFRTSVSALYYTPLFFMETFCHVFLLSLIVCSACTASSSAVIKIKFRCVHSTHVPLHVCALCTRGSSDNIVTSLSRLGVEHGNGSYFPIGEAAHSPPSISEVKNAWS
jgi:hypothetical protein